MKIMIELSTDNAAFQESTGAEAGRILQDVAEILRYWATTPAEIVDKFDGGYKLRDINGNVVGHVTVTDWEEDE